MEIYGNTAGLSPVAQKALERIYRRKVPATRVTSPELTRSLVEAAQLAGRQVGALVHRSGQVDYVVVGDGQKLMLPDVGRLRAGEGRLRGVRLIHTHLFGEALTKDDLTDLVRLRLDLVCAIQLSPSFEVRGHDWAIPVPPEPGEKPYEVHGPFLPGRDDTDFAALITDVEGRFRKRSQTREVRAKDGRAILVHVGEKNKRTAHREAEAGIRELRELAMTAGVEVVDAIVQLRDAIDPRLVMGKGKLDDVLVRAAELDAETLIFDRNLSPSQASAIAKHTELKVIDRSQLILDIFAQRAESRDGKLQVELAQLKYSLPRLAQKDDSLSRLTGGIGGRGPGETKLEIGRRRAKERVTHLEAELRRLAKQREQRRRKRTRQDVPVVSIVGYTNAGKSTLLNTLTDSDVLAENKLFATLDTRSRRLRFPEEREVVLTDTVGFIRDLPEALFAAFRATFEEAADADLILHVVDASDEQKDVHMKTTEKVLSDLELGEVPVLLVFNKADLLAPGDAEKLLAAHPSAVFTSALHRETTRPVLDRIRELLQERWTRAAMVPEPVVVEEEPEDRAHPPRDEVTTLEEMLKLRKKRR